MKHTTCIFTFIFVLYAHQNIFADEPFTISPETTYITEPLREDGRGVDYFAAIEERLYPDTMQTDDNGYRIIVRELGVISDNPRTSLPDIEQQIHEKEKSQCREGLFKKLGIDPNIEPSSTYQEPEDFIETYFAATEPDADHEMRWDIEKKARLPWTKENSPILARWLEENSAALDIVASAVERPDFCIPLIRIDHNEPLYISINFDEWQSVRGFARGLSARANYRIGSGDVDGAIDDIETCYHLGARCKQQYNLLGCLVGMAAQGIAASVNVAYSNENHFSEEQLQRLLAIYNRPYSSHDIAETMYYERLLNLDLYQGFALGDYSEEAFTECNYPSLKQFALENIDWDVLLTRHNKHFINPDIEIQRIRNKRKGDDRSWEELLADGVSQTELLGDVFFLQLSGISASYEADRRVHCGKQILSITLAFLIHEQRNGTLPSPYIVDADGNPMHSWRVLLLPYIGQQELYDEIRINEPWDSEHNRQFHEIDVPFYTCPSAEAEPGQTSYAVVVGEHTAFNELFAEFGPKSVPQILVVERQTPVCWMDPTQEFSMRPRWEWINGDGELIGSNHPGEVEMIGSNHPGGMNVGLRSGSVSFISETTARSTFIEMLKGTCPIEEMP